MKIIPPIGSTGKNGDGLMWRPAEAKQHNNAPDSRPIRLEHLVVRGLVASVIELGLGPRALLRVGIVPLDVAQLRVLRHAVSPCEPADAGVWRRAGGGSSRRRRRDGAGAARLCPEGGLDSHSRVDPPDEKAHLAVIGQPLQPPLACAPGAQVSADAPMLPPAPRRLQPRGLKVPKYPRAHLISHLGVALRRHCQPARRLVWLRAQQLGLGSEETARAPAAHRQPARRGDRTSDAHGAAGLGRPKWAPKLIRRRGTAHR
eukprot:scaffold16060_cov107-Isochrysis_galbana.AAC.11